MKKFPIDFLKPYEKNLKVLNVIVETPKGSRVKYAYDEDKGLFAITKMLPDGMVFPFNFGFIPGTLAEDGDPLDMLILNEEPVVSSTWLTVRPLAVIKATQTENGKKTRNDRLVGQALSKEVPVEMRELKLEKPMVKQIEAFFVNYNQLYGQKFKVLGTGGAGKATRMVIKAIKAFKKNKKSK